MYPEKVRLLITMEIFQVATLFTVLFFCLVMVFIGLVSNTRGQKRPKILAAVVLPESPNMNIAWKDSADFSGINFVLYPYMSPQANVTLRIPVNKGFEAMTYLTYIIQFYDNLPSKIFFAHGHFRSWHQVIDCIFISVNAFLIF